MLATGHLQHDMEEAPQALVDRVVFLFASPRLFVCLSVSRFLCLSACLFFSQFAFMYAILHVSLSLCVCTEARPGCLVVCHLFVSLWLLSPPACFFQDRWLWVYLVNGFFVFLCVCLSLTVLFHCHSVCLFICQFVLFVCIGCILSGVWRGRRSVKGIAFACVAASVLVLLF